MISDLAHYQNTTKRKTYEGLGYKFSLGSDGWALMYEADQVAHGYTTRGVKGEQAVREGLDHAILAAKKHTQSRVVPTPVPAPTNAPVTPPKTSKATAAQKKAVKTALQFLDLAGAKYCIEFDGQVLGTLHIRAPEAPKEVRTNYRQYYGPILYPYKNKGAFNVTMDVPKEIDFDAYVVAIKGYLIVHYGRGNAVVDANAKTRKIEIIVVSVKDEE